MAIRSCSFLFLVLSLSIFISTQSFRTKVASPYLSPTILFANYQKMLTSFRIYAYKPAKPFTFTTESESLFYNSLLISPFLTQDPEAAHLFFVPFPSDMSMRVLSRLVRDLRISFPYWNRTLGADHFYLSCTGIGYAADRNVLELKKNSIQISCFPTTSGNFIPHKDVTLPSLNPSNLYPLELPHALVNTTLMSLGYMKSDGKGELELVKELNNDPEFVIESEAADLMMRLNSSKFCLFVYSSDVSWLGEALRMGCVPVVITERPIQDLPFMDIVRWSDIAVFVGAQKGVTELKKVLSLIDGEQYDWMKGLGMKVGLHFTWNGLPQAYDAFHMVMYQLWLRRHTIRYALREWN